MFEYSSFRKLTIADRDLLSPILLQSDELSCEFGFATLVGWATNYSPEYQMTENALYLYLEPEDLLTFTALPGCRPPDAEELIQVSGEMRRAGRDGVFSKLRKEVIDAIPGIGGYFEIRKENRDLAEYIHEVDRLINLPGKKLAKKRNLISQFRRIYPNYEIRDMKPENYGDCLKIASVWAESQPDRQHKAIVHEYDAICLMERFFHLLDSVGLVLYVDEKPVAFCTASPISKDIYTESFEKALHDCKGAAQFLNHELALRLKGRCRYLNREQDLGLEGMRHAKLSYDPDLLLESWELHPLDHFQTAGK